MSTLFYSEKLGDCHYLWVPSEALCPDWSHPKKKTFWSTALGFFQLLSLHYLSTSWGTNLVWKSTSRDFKPGFHSYNEKVLSDRWFELPQLQFQPIPFCPLPLRHWTPKLGNTTWTGQTIVWPLAFHFQFLSESQNLTEGGGEASIRLIRFTGK